MPGYCRTFMLLACCGLVVPGLSAEVAAIKTVRVPEGGLQPQVAVDGQGTAHLIYFLGDPGAGDLWYSSTQDGGATFSKAIRVNGHPKSAVAMGTIRGAHLAVGKGGRVHVAWMGSKNAEPKGPNGATPMLYARLNDDGTAFEPQRNVMQFAEGLDGGGSVASDDQGNVYVVWHGEAGQKGEGNRRVFVARSSDEGKSFSQEVPAFNQATGACACCGMRAFAAKDGKVYALYRSATNNVNRDMFLIVSRDRGASFAGGLLQPWVVNQCVMSTAALVEGGAGVVAAWETKEQVYFTSIDPKLGRPGPPMAAPGPAVKRKHPALSANAAGDVLLIWTEGTGWNKGGRLSWQLYDKTGKPGAVKGSADGVPAWSFGAGFATASGFTVVY